MLKKIIVLISFTLPALAMEESQFLLDHNQTGNGPVYLNSHTSSSESQLPFFLPLLDTALNLDGITLSQNGNPYLGTYPSAYSVQDGNQLLPHPFYDPSHPFWEGTLFSKNTPNAAQEIFGSSTTEFDVDAFLDYAVMGDEDNKKDRGDDSQASINMLNALKIACQHSQQNYLMPDGSPNIPVSAYGGPFISMPPSTLYIDVLTQRK